MTDHLATLPIELLCYIFALLPLSKEKVQAQLVNKACKAALSDPLAYSVDTWEHDLPCKSDRVIRLPLACLRHRRQMWLPETPSACFVPATVQRFRLDAHNLASCPVLPAVTVLEVYAWDIASPRPEVYPPFPCHKFPAVESIEIRADRRAKEGIATLLKSDFSGLQSLSRFSCSLIGPIPFDLNVPPGCAVHLCVNPTSYLDPGVWPMCRGSNASCIICSS